MYVRKYLRIYVYMCVNMYAGTYVCLLVYNMYMYIGICMHVCKNVNA